MLGNARTIILVYIHMTKTEIEKYFTTNAREFNPVVFAHLFTKVRTIGFSTNSLSNKEFLQYKEATINTNIRIAKTYLEEAQKSLDDTELKKSLQNVYDFLKLVYDEYKEELKATSAL